MSVTKPLTKLPAILLLIIALALGAASVAHAQSEPVKTATPNPGPASSAATKPASESLDNPYGLKAMIEHGDLVSKGVLGILMIMSLGTWYILVSKVLEQRKLLTEAKAVGANSSFWAAGTLQQGTEKLEKEGAFRFIADTAIEATKRHEGVLAGVDLGSWITTSLEEAGEDVEHRLQKGLALLATVGATSPFIGLFGTVWGILNALTAIGVAGQASIDKVAGPVGEALIMTALGLAVAVPAVLGYNWLVGRNTTSLHYVTTFGSKLRATLLSAPARA
jgi:biopolymer transport protein ExbB